MQAELAEVQKKKAQPVVTKTSRAKQEMQEELNQLKKKQVELIITLRSP